jgi:hypothetical protein
MPEVKVLFLALDELMPDPLQNAVRLVFHPFIDSGWRLSGWPESQGAPA